MNTTANVPCALKCDTCKHMGHIYFDGGYRPSHSCHKSDTRRAETMKPTGDRAEDFMQNFRTFFDAHAGDTACRHYEERDVIGNDDLQILRLIADGGGKADFGFFSDENRRAHDMRNKFTKQDSYGYGVPRGLTRWYLTDLGKSELLRAQAVPL